MTITKHVPDASELAGIIKDAADSLDGNPENFCSWSMANAAAEAVYRRIVWAVAEIERLRKIETAARALKFSAYPAHGSGFVLQVSGGNINNLEAALAAHEYGHADDFINGRQQHISAGTVAVLLNAVDRLKTRVAYLEYTYVKLATD